MLENEYRYLADNKLINEASHTEYSFDPASGYENSGEFWQIAVPMVRRTFPELIAHEVVGVQPMNTPVGIAFALRFKAGQSYDGSGPGVELGYNTIDSTYSGSYVTTAGEALGSSDGSGVGSDIGLGIGSGDHIKEVNLHLEKAQVEAETRKLRSRWSLEVAQDLNAMHGLNIEDEMMDILAYEITAEIDREIMAAVRTAANNNSYSYVSGQQGTLDWTNSTQFDGRWEHEKYRNLYNYIVRHSNRIAVLTRRGAGNFVIGNPTVCAALEGTSAFTVAPVDSTVNTAVTGVARLGTLDGRLTVFRDTFATNDEYVVGYKGASEFDAGLIYLPYVQLQMMRATFENSFNPSIGLMSRYALHNQI